MNRSKFSQCSEERTSVSDQEVAKFRRIAAKALARINQERPSVVVPTYSRRSKGVEEIIGGKTPELYFDLIAYVGDTRYFNEAHREAVMFGWLRGYSSVPKWN